MTDTSTQEHERSGTADLILPEDMTGATLLDVGTDDGYMPCEALRRGAAFAAGADISRSKVLQCRESAREKGLEPEFFALDIASQSPPDVYDYVTCLNLLQGLPDPIAAIDRLIAATRRTLIVELEEFRTSWLRRLFLRDMPLVYLRSGGYMGAPRRYMISSLAMKSWLWDHHAVFGRVEIIPSNVSGRYLAVAHRRRIKHLIVIAGPTSAGKSTLIDDLQKGKAATVAQRLEMGDSTTWRYLDPQDFRKIEEVEMDRVVLHLDFLSRLKWDIEDYRRMPYMELFGVASRTNVLTLGVEPDQLLRQFQKGEIDDYARQHGQAPRHPKTVRLQKDYRDPALIEAFYRHWFDFVQTLDADHVVANVTAEPRFYDVEQWTNRTRVPSNQQS